jgi:teichuronic acid biosynthesis glycosyltransferase TuaC
VRVLFLVTDYPSESHPASGIFHKTQVEALQRLGVSLDVVAPLPTVPFGLHLIHPRWAGYRAIARRQVFGGLQIHRPRYVHWPLRLHVGPGADAAFARATMKVLSAKPDILHAHFAYPPGLAAARLARRLGIPTVLTLHGSDVNVLPERSRRNAARFRRAAGSADALIAVSTALADRAEALTGRRPDVLPIGIPLQRFRNPPSREEARKTLGLQPEARVVAYVGQLARAKGIREFLESMRRLAAHGVEGIVVGDGRERREAQGVQSVRCYGAQPNDRVPLFMAAADALVLPSYSEGLPTVLVEAGAVGTPVIATGVGGIPELLGNGRGFLVPVGSVEALVEAIGRVLADRQSAAARAARLKRHVQEAYDADRNAARLLSLYRELLSRSHGLQAERS